MLRIGGAFLATNAWLNGRLLGSHYGHFAPFGFDLTPYLKPDNELVICCESPVELELDRKRHIMGLFNDGDLRPYPASAYMSLGEPLTSAEQEPHLPALQFQRTAKSLACSAWIWWMASSTTMPGAMLVL